MVHTMVHTMVHVYTILRMVHGAWCAATKGAYTVQSGYTGKRSDQLLSHELVGVNTLRTNLTINFQGFHFPDAGPKTPIIGMDYFSQQSESNEYSVPECVDFRNSCLHFRQPNEPHVKQMGFARVPAFSTAGVVPSHDVQHNYGSTYTTRWESVCPVARSLW
jgi:hypothetical protein